MERFSYTFALRQPKRSRVGRLLSKPWDAFYNERLEIGLVSTGRRSKFSLVGPQLSQKFHPTTDTELESEVDGHRRELPPTEEESASNSFPAKSDIKLAGRS